jgi:hypothetical protein
LPVHRVFQPTVRVAEVNGGTDAEQLRKNAGTVWLVLTAGGSSLETWHTGQILRQFRHNENSDPKGSFLGGVI